MGNNAKKNSNTNIKRDQLPIRQHTVRITKWRALVHTAHISIKLNNNCWYITHGKPLSNSDSAGTEQVPPSQFDIRFKYHTRITESRWLRDSSWSADSVVPGSIPWEAGWWAITAASPSPSPPLEQGESSAVAPWSQEDMVLGPKPTNQPHARYVRPR